MKAIIKDKKEIAKGTLWLEFALEKKISFEPGQIFYINLRNPPFTDPEGDMRHFSIVNPPSHADIIQMATRITDSAFKRSLKELPLGTEVEIHSIMGSFQMPKDQSRHVVFIAGGIGITPFMSMLRHAKETGLSQEITLLYSNRDNESTAFYDELNQMSQEMKNFKPVYTMTEDKNWKEESRMVESDFIKEYLPDYKEDYFMFAGPPAMVDAVRKALKKLDVKNKNINPETFTGY
jgi:ferredoxin-NADP reductase